MCVPLCICVFLPCAQVPPVKQQKVAKAKGKATPKAKAKAKASPPAEAAPSPPAEAVPSPPAKAAAPSYKAKAKAAALRSTSKASPKVKKLTLKAKPRPEDDPNLLQIVPFKPPVQPPDGAMTSDQRAWQPYSNNAASLFKVY